MAIAQSGLMISAGTDANRSVENQDYEVTRFGEMVDRYSLSFDDEERWKLWKCKEGKQNTVSFKTNTAEVDGDTLILH